MISEPRLILFGSCYIVNNLWSKREMTLSLSIVFLNITMVKKLPYIEILNMECVGSLIVVKVGGESILCSMDHRLIHFTFSLKLIESLMNNITISIAYISKMHDEYIRERHDTLKQPREQHINHCQHMRTQNISWKPFW